MTLVEGIAVHGSAARPVVVSLTKDLLLPGFREQRILAATTRDPLSLLKAILVLALGADRRQASASEVVAATLPYREDTLARLRQLRDTGRTLHLAGDGNEDEARAVADHLGMFDRVFADGATGDVWTDEHYSEMAAVQPLLARLRQLCVAWIRELRPHQWVKNLLVGVALIVGQHFEPTDLIDCAIAFIALSLCASSVYILNDIVDLADDRAHPTKRFRPIAAGQIPVRQALFVAPILALTGVAVALLSSTGLVTLVTVYLFGSIGYSFYFKRKIVLDAVVLSGLYVLRVLAGAIAVDHAVSEWLISFSGLLFFSLGLVKRQVEYRDFDEARLRTSSRRYSREDLQVLAALAAGSGANAVTVFCLYANSPESREIYSDPMLLFLAAPVLLYWLSRLILLANRGLVHDDPVMFALRDRSSIVCAILIGLTLLAAN